LKFTNKFSIEKAVIDVNNSILRLKECDETTFLLKIINLPKFKVSYILEDDKNNYNEFFSKFKKLTVNIHRIMEISVDFEVNNIYC
jgi:IS1 family transposase